MVIINCMMCSSCTVYYPCTVVNSCGFLYSLSNSSWHTKESWEDLSESTDPEDRILDDEQQALMDAEQD